MFGSCPDIGLISSAGLGLVVFLGGITSCDVACVMVCARVVSDDDEEWLIRVHHGEARM